MPRLQKTLGLASLTFYGVGMIVGAGVYSVIGEAAGAAGDAVWLAFALGAAVALLTGLSYAEMATLFPRAGAEYVYVRRAFPSVRAAPFAVGVILVAAAAATAATVALAFAGYLAGFLDVPKWAAALVLLAILTAVNLLGMRLSSGVNATFTLLETAGLVVFIRQATNAQNLRDLLPLVDARNERRLCLCTDDRQPADLLDEGHMDALVRMAIAAGLLKAEGTG